MAIQYRGDYRAQGAGSWSSLFGLQAGLTFAWDTSALTAGNYEIRVQAHDTVSGVDSDWSATRQFTVQHAVINTPPPAPAVLVPVQGQSVDQSVTVDLSLVSDPEGDVVFYRAERRLAGGNWVSLFGPDLVRTFVWNTAALAPGSYEIRAYASDGSLESGASAIRSFSIVHPPPPPAVQDFLVLDGEVIPVQTQAASEGEPFIPGVLRRSFNGRLLGSAWGPRRRQWHVTTVPLIDADFHSLDNHLRATAPISATGTMFGGATITVFVTVSGVDYVRDNGGFRRSLTLDLDEI